METLNGAVYSALADDERNQDEAILRDDVAPIQHFHARFLRIMLILLLLGGLGFWQPGFWWSLPWVALFTSLSLLWHGLSAYQVLRPWRERYTHFLLERRKNKPK